MSIILSSRDRRINNLYNDFIANAKNDIAKYFQIEGYKFQIKRIDSSIFRFRFKTIKRLNIALPDDLIQHIKSFIIEDVLLEITYPLAYPFSGPTWKILTNSNKYNRLIQIHNRSYEMEWSPAITFEKDILYMVHDIVNFGNK